MWLVYSLTGSTLLLGMVGFAGQVPVFLLAPVGGALADARDRRRIILATQAASMATALILAGLTLSGSVRLWHVFAIAATLGVVNAFDIPARQSFLADLVGRADLMNAIALNSTMFNAARIVGPAAAGLLVAAVGEGWCFLLNGLSYVAVLGALLAMRPKPRAARPPAGSPLGRIAEGFGYVARTGPIRALLLLLGLVSLAGMPYSVLMPVFAAEVLHAGPRGLGLLLGALGLGVCLGTVTPARKREIPGLGRWVARATAALGLGLLGFAASRQFWLSAAILVPVGYAMLVQTRLYLPGLRVVTRQLLSEQEMIGGEPSGVAAVATTPAGPRGPDSHAPGPAGPGGGDGPREGLESPAPAG